MKKTNYNVLRAGLTAAALAAATGSVAVEAVTPASASESYTLSKAQKLTNGFLNGLQNGRVSNKYIAPGVHVKYGPGTEVLQTPTQISDVGDGSPNVVFKVKNGHHLSIAGVVAGSVPGSGNSAQYEAFTYTSPSTDITNVYYVEFNGQTDSSAHTYNEVQLDGPDFAYTKSDGQRVQTATGQILPGNG